MVALLTLGMEMIGERWHHRTMPEFGWGGHGMRGRRRWRVPMVVPVKVTQKDGGWYWSSSSSLGVLRVVAITSLLAVGEAGYGQNGAHLTVGRPHCRQHESNYRERSVVYSSNEIAVKGKLSTERLGEGGLLARNKPMGATEL